MKVTFREEKKMYIKKGLFFFSQIALLFRLLKIIKLALFTYKESQTYIAKRNQPYNDDEVSLAKFC